MVTRSNEPRVSVVTSLYRGERYLENYLRSLASQTILDDIEVLLDHNLPTESELEMVRAFEAEHPGVIRHHIQTELVSISSSWNNCIGRSNGRYLAIWNVDDTRTPDSLEIQADYLDTHPEIGVVHGRYGVVSAVGSTEGPVIDYRSVPMSEHRRDFYLGPFLMFRSDLVEKVGLFDEQLRVVIDYDFALRLAYNTDIGAVDGLLGFFLDEGKGLSTRNDSPLERENSAVRMRYGVLDLVPVAQVRVALNYRVMHVINGGTERHVALMIPSFRRVYIMNSLRGLKIKAINFVAFRPGKTG